MGANPYPSYFYIELHLGWQITIGIVIAVLIIIWIQIILGWLEIYND